LQPKPMGLFCRMSLILLPLIVPPFTPSAIRMPVTTSVDPAAESIPAMVLLIMEKFCAFASSMPWRRSFSAATVEPKELPVMFQF
jgi:hypothetical protein